MPKISFFPLSKIGKLFSFCVFKILVVICSLFLYSNHVNCYNILGLFPYPGKSHYMIFEPLMVELARRGHNVTSYNTFPKSYSTANYREINIKHCFSLPKSNLAEMLKRRGSFDFGRTFVSFGPNYEEISGCTPLLELWNSGEKYDLMITETFLTEFFQLFAFKLNIPVLKLRAIKPVPSTSTQISLPDNPSYIPFSDTEFDDRMNFLQRCENFLVNLYWRFYQSMSERRYDEMAARIFGPEVPSFNDIAQNTSMILFYSHFTLSYPRPDTPDAIEVAGLHITEPKTIPQVSTTCI